MQFQFYSETYLPQVNEAVGDFVSDLIWGDTNRFKKYCSLAVASESQLLAGVIYHNFQPDCGTIEVSCAARSPRWMTRDVIRAGISMPFDNLGCQTIFARHSEDNKNARHIWQSLGATEYVIPRLRGRHEPPEVIAVLTEEAWAASHYNTTKIAEKV